MNIADRIGQLNALRFEMQSGKFNLSRSDSEEIMENETPGMRKAIPKEGTYIKYGDASRKVGIDAIGKLGDFAGVTFSGIPDE